MRNMVNIDPNEINWSKHGLVPAILQDELSGTVLMLGYMDLEALLKTIRTKTVWFYSRSRKTLWQKGETSKNFQMVKDIYLDCDKDTILVKVKSKGPVCHLGTSTCFGEQNMLPLEKLARVIAQRKLELPEDSYTTYLFREGLDKILKKVGEESSEVIIAAKNPNKEDLASESADLLYHLFVLFQERGLSYREVLRVLEERRKK